MDNEKNVFERCKTDSAYVSEGILNKIGLNNNVNNFKIYKPLKKNKIHLEQTPFWNEYKKGTGERKPNPKCDLIIEDIPFSIKSGEGRATSANEYETSALFKSVLNEYTPNDILSNNVNEIIKNMKEIREIKSLFNKGEIEENYNANNNSLNEKEIEWYEKYLLKNTIINNLWHDLLEINEDFYKKIIFECLRGYHKFGSNIGRADYLIQTENSKSTEIEVILDLRNYNDEVDKYCSKIIKNNKNPFRIKSGGKNKVTGITKIWYVFL